MPYFTLPLFVCPACHMQRCFFPKRGSQSAQLQLHTPLLSSLLSCASIQYLVLISDLIISLLRVSVALFGVNFCPSFQNYFWVSQRLPQWQACLPVSHVPSFAALCDLLLHADRNRSRAGRTHIVCVCVCVCVRM